MLNKKQTGCILQHHLKALAGTSIIANIGCRRFRSAVNSLNNNEEKGRFRMKLFLNFTKRRFQKSNNSNHCSMCDAEKVQSDDEKAEKSLAVQGPLMDSAFYYYLMRREMVKNSYRKLMGSSSQILNIHEYMLWKMKEDYGVNNLGFYVSNKNSENTYFCNRKLSTSFQHKLSVIDNILDYDKIDTENTDYTYIHEEEQYDESDTAGQVEEAEAHLDEFEFNGKIISLTNTEILTNSQTLPYV